jgi:hypothetical protein
VTIGSISAAGLGQYVLASGNTNPLQQALQSLQDSLALGDLNGAQSAFQTLQNLYQNSATSSGSTLSSNSQFASDLAALGSALTSGDLSTAQSAFAMVQSDLKNSASPAQVNEATAASQSVQLVEELLSTVNSSRSSSDSSGTSDLTNSILQSVYGSQSKLNVFA